MTMSDIEAVIEAYGQSAASAHKLGFDGVSIHAAHGYLIDQFFWDKTNLRNDRYGGSLENRSRFAAEIVGEIRRRTSPEFPISLRFSQWKGHDFNAKLASGPQELERMLRPIIDAGIDMLECSQRRFWEPEFAGSDLSVAGWTKKVTGLPTVTVGSVSLDAEMNPLQAQRSQPVRIDRLLEMLERGDFDLVAVGRALIANPDWPQIIRDRAYDRLKPYDPNMLKTVC
jgi:2,4-dienoyl-CoA reductase-like NADH-dependent reductase (Old Yellow Enzyme family)